jgi:hypothetical protein
MQFLFFLGLCSDCIKQSVLTPQLIKLELSAVKALLASGKIRDAWNRADVVGIVVLFDGLTEVECRSVVSGLPFSIAEILEIEKVVPIKPFLEAYP